MDDHVTMTMKKREADFSLVLRHWIKAEMPFRDSCAIEVKQTRTNRLPFSDVQEHQIDALQAASTYMGLLYKAPDDSRGVKPFDFFYMKNAGAWVVIKYPGQFSVISKDAFLAEKKRSEEKSLTKERAEAIAWKTVVL